MSPAWLAGLSADGDAEWIDTDQRGLVLRVRRGHMVWFVRYLFEGEARRYRIGEHPEIGLSAARKLAAVARGRAAAGEDPQAERRAKREAARCRRLGETVEKAVASWLKDKKQGFLGRWRDGLDGGSARAALPHIHRLERMLGKKLLTEVTPKDIERVVLAPAAPATRNRALCAVRGFAGWAIRSGLMEKDPTRVLHKEHETARTRVLSDDEIRTLITGFDPTRYGRAVRLLFLTGVRREEVLGLRWTWIDLQKGIITTPPRGREDGPDTGRAAPGGPHAPGGRPARRAEAGSLRGGHPVRVRLRHEHRGAPPSRLPQAGPLPTPGKTVERPPALERQPCQAESRRAPGRCQDP